MKANLGVDRFLQRDRLFVFAGLIGISALAWAYTVYLAWDMHRMGMASGRAMAMPMTADWTAADFGLMFLMWAVMMVAMMVPSASPMILLFGTVARNRKARTRPYVSTAVFVTGYTVVWTLFALAGTSTQWGLHAATLLSPMTMQVTPWIAGLLLITAGLYQLTPFKRLCLTECRTPLNFLMTEWREGRSGALVMGARHGLYCLGCCWVLMALLFVLGVMNLVWIAALAGIVLVEKVAPGSRWITLGTGIGLFAWGAWLLAVDAI